MRTIILSLLSAAGIAALPAAGLSQVVATITGEFTAAGDLEVGPDRKVYVADFGFSLNGGANGTDVYRVTPSGDVSVFASGLLGASGNAFDAEGNLYQSNIASGRISKITPDGTVTTFTSGPGIGGPVGVAVDEDGNVYNTNCGLNTISRTTPAGTTATYATGALLSCPNGLTIDPDGNLYTSNFNNCNVMKIDALGEVSRVGCASTFGAPNVGNGHITYANDRLYVAGWRGGVIFEMPLDGTPVSVLAGAGGSGREDGTADVARFHQPNGIDATPDGDTLYVNDTVNLASGGVLLHPNVVRMITGVRGEITSAESEVPRTSDLELSALYPNPVVSDVNVEYVLGESSEIRLELVDLLGRSVGTLDEGFRRSGRHRVGLHLPSVPPGTYLITLSSAKGSAAEIMQIAR